MCATSCDSYMCVFGTFVGLDSHILDNLSSVKRSLLFLTDVSLPSCTSGLWDNYKNSISDRGH